MVSIEQHDRHQTRRAAADIAAFLKNPQTNYAYWWEDADAAPILESLFHAIQWVRADLLAWTAEEQRHYDFIDASKKLIASMKKDDTPL